MKKLIIFVLTLFLTVTIFLSGKSANAELTPVTPIYEGDILNGKELYLFQNYSATPNFENGYISKKTITQQDVYYQENSFYNGWYKDLGRELIDNYTEPEHEPENPYFWFYIPLNNMTAQYLQLALIMPEPYESDFYLKFKNETPINFLTTNGNGDYLITPPTTNMLKEIEWICYSVYYQDYLASFRTLTAEIAYDFGFSAGESVGYNRGFNSGYSTGYNNGHTDGYNEGSIDTQYGVNTVVDFNQLIQNGNFEGSSYWEPTTCSLTTTGEYPTFVATAQYGRITQRNIPLKQNHKYCFLGNLKLTTPGTYMYLQIIRDTNQTIKSSRNTNEWQKLDIIFNYTQSTGNVAFVMGDSRSSGWDNVYITNFMLLDLTQIYGTGNEPTTLQTIYDDFPSSYYNFTTSSLINIDYENGYIKGQKLGYNQGYDDGKDAQATQQLTSSGWIGSIFGGISSLLNIQIFPGVTIGIIVGIPFVISLAYFVIRAFRGGGGA